MQPCPVLPLCHFRVVITRGIPTSGEVGAPDSHTVGRSTVYYSLGHCARASSKSPT